ncbi:ATP-binding protein [Myxococcota bacterium]|nr:ATP-binding protein [Myxococcota bacterium]
MTGELGRETFRTRLLRVMLVRLLVVTVLFALATYGLFQASGADTGRILSAYSIVIAAYTFSTVYAAAMRRVDNLRRFAFLQFAVDSLCIGAASYWVGNATGVFLFPQLYVLQILGAGLLLLTRGALVFAAVDSILYVSVGLLTPPSDASDAVALTALLDNDSNSLLTLTRTITNVFAFFLTAFVSGSLTRRVEESEAALETTGASLRHLRELHGNIVENIRSGILTSDLAGRITSFNAAAEKLTGIPASLAAGRPVVELFPEAAERLKEPALTDSLGPESGGSWEQWYRGDARRRLYLRFAVSDLRDPRRAPIGRILIFDDITRLRHVEEQLERDERLAALGRLASGIVHEIRNPLASISGSVQLLRSCLDLREDDRRLMDIVIREADRLNGLVTNFLGFARNPTPNLGRVRPDRIAAEVLQMARSQGWSSGTVEVRERFESEEFVHADPDQLRQILWNLVLNAVQAMPRGGTITVGTRVLLGYGPKDPKDSGVIRVGDWYELSVRDTGVGMEPEQLARIFDPFVTQKSGGTGLGLAIVQRIVDAHGGCISVESSPGRGASFLVFLPLTGEGDSNAAAGHPARDVVPEPAPREVR